MQRKSKGKDYVVTLVMAGLLAAMNVILGKFFQITPTEYLRFSIGSLPVIFAGIVFGPLIGGAVGLVGDLVGCIAAGMAINPIIGVGSAVVGVVAGLFKPDKMRGAGYIKFFIACFAAHFIGSVIIKSIGMYVYYSTPVSMLALRFPTAVGNSVIEALILKVLFARTEIMNLIPRRGQKGGKV